MYDRILIPVDGSEEAKRAAAYGIQFAQAFDSAVDVLHVLDQRSRRLTKTSSEKTRLKEHSEEIIEEIEQIAVDLDYSISLTTVEGVPAVRIVEYAMNEDIELLIMGRQGMTGPRKRLLGGVTEGVIYQGDLPVLVVPSFDQPVETDIGYSRLLFPTDGSKNSDIAIEHVIEIAKHFDAVIHVVNVVDLQAAGGVFNAGGLENTFVKRLETDGKNILDSVEAEITETTPELDVEPVVVHTSSFEGVAAGIREYVTERDFDLIVMGSHGRSNIKRQLIGSVASTVLRTVDVPVLVIKRPAQQAQ